MDTKEFLQKKTIKQLKEIARSRDLTGYSRKNKEPLIDLILANAPLTNFTAISKPMTDTQNSNPPSPVVKPTKVKSFKSMANRIYAAAKKKTNDLANWLLNLVPKKPEILDKAYGIVKNKILNLFKKKKEPFVLEESKEPFVLRETESALNRFTVQYTIDGREGYDPESFLEEVKQLVTKKLKSLDPTKVKMILKCMMQKTAIATGEVTETEAAFCSNVEENLAGSNVDEMYKDMVDRVQENLATFQMQGSDWQFVSIVSLEIHTVKYEPLKGSSYIPLPKALKGKTAIINPQNTEDNECFKWCITRALNPVDKNAGLITKELEEQAKKYNWDGINFPTEWRDIDRFEKQNSGISVNVLGYEEGNDIHPLRLTEFANVNRSTVNLLLISDDEGNWHYCWIKNMSRLLASQTSKHKCKRHFCLRCLNGFHSEQALNNHLERCLKNEVVKVDYPDPEKGTLSFMKYMYGRSMMVPFVVYCDSEAILHPIHTCQPNPSESYTNQYQKHTPSSFCYYIMCFDDKIYSREPVVITKEKEDDDVAQIFVNRLEQEVKDIYKLQKERKKQFEDIEKMIFNEDDKKAYDEATTCHICKKPLNKDKVMDHCHLSGRFRGAAHNECNLNYKLPNFIPVIFHNLSGYDSHLFIRQLGKNEGEITCIANTEEKYISFSKKVVVAMYYDEDGKAKDVTIELRFIDSFRFMASSLDKLSKNMKKDQFKNLGQYYSGKQFDLLCRKNVYPYDWVDSLKKLDEQQLPTKEEFYSKLNDGGISDDDYKHAQEVWDEFNIKTFRDYHNLYNISDVLILADVFENFRDICIDNYGLDPAWYYTSPGLAWNAALKITGVTLELMSDPHMVLMVEHGIRGGVSTISHRYGKANNPYMGDKYDHTQPTKYLIYNDANNLYGWAMSQNLPTGGFEWMKPDELVDWKKFSEVEGQGCILEVDLEYPDELHDLHNDYPLAPENIEVGKVSKLIPNLNNKTKYVIHYKNLRQYEHLGLRITKIHSGIKFYESKWLKEYIDLNTRLRTKATNEFEKDFFKLMNNSVYGKTLENVRNRVDIRLVTTKDKARKLAAKPHFRHCTIFDENLVAMHMKKTKVVLNKPVYLGMCILDLSKTLMYDFHYRYVKDRYGDKVKLLFTDTDSLAYEIETEDYYKDISPDVEEWFDTSEYPNDHPSGIKAGINKKVLGMMKDELSGKIMEEFVGLRAKLYSYKLLEGKESKKCKGVKKCVVDKKISLEDYKRCLLEGRKQIRQMNEIRSHLHEVYTEEVNKVALSGEDDKRKIMEDGIHTKANGHYSLL